MSIESLLYQLKIKGVDYHPHDDCIVIHWKGKDYQIKEVTLLKDGRIKIERTGKPVAERSILIDSCASRTL